MRTAKVPTPPTGDERMYTIRVDRRKLDQLREIAEGEHRKLSDKFRLMVDEEIARHTSGCERSAA